MLIRILKLMLIAFWVCFYNKGTAKHCLDHARKNLVFSRKGVKRLPYKCPPVQGIFGLWLGARPKLGALGFS